MVSFMRIPFTTGSTPPPATRPSASRPGAADRALAALLAVRSVHEWHAKRTRLTDRARRQLAATGIAVE